MKRIILSLGMLIAVATASYAQNNTSTLVQTDGARNTATMDQKGQLNQATITQVGVQTTDNKAEIRQTGRSSVSIIGEDGKNNDVLTIQNNTSVGNHTSQVYIQGANSEHNNVRVTQAGKGMTAFIAIQGDGKPDGATPVSINQSGDTNAAALIMNNGENDFNTVSITQTGKDGQSRTQIQGDNNNIKIEQGGNTNNIGNYSGLGPVLSAGFTRFRLGNSLAGANFIGANATPVGISVNAGINVIGDRNIIEITQGATTTYRNFIGIELAGSPA